MKVTIETINHKDQRYPTVGDYFYDEAGDLVVRVSRLTSWKREMLVAVHELVEFILCKNDGVSHESIDKFDKEFEAHRHPDNFDEPGDDPHAPYMRQHCIATGVERLLAANLGVSWSEYADEIESLL